MKITVNGQVHDFEWSSVTVNEGIRVQERTGKLYAEFRPALSAEDLVAWKALCALLVERTMNEPLNWDGFDAVWDEVTVEVPADASDPSGSPEQPEPPSPTT